MKTIRKLRRSVVERRSRDERRAARRSRVSIGRRKSSRDGNFFPAPARIRRAIDDAFSMSISRDRRSEHSGARTCSVATVESVVGAVCGREETLVDSRERIARAASLERFAKRRRPMPNGHCIAGRDSLHEVNRVAFCTRQVIENQALTKTLQIAAQTRSADCEGQIDVLKH